MGRAEAHDWACELISGDQPENTVLRLHVPAGNPEPMDIVVRDRGDGPYFAFARIPHHVIAPVSDLDQAVRVIVFFACCGPVANLVHHP